MKHETLSINEYIYRGEHYRNVIKLTGMKNKVINTRFAYVDDPNIQFETKHALGM